MILTAQLMVVLDTTIVNVVLPHIQRSLAFTATGLSWVINAYIQAEQWLVESPVAEAS